MNEERQQMVGIFSTIVEDYNGWDGDHENMQFYDPKLKVPFGTVKAGEILVDHTISFDIGKSVVQVYNPANKIVAEASIKLILD